MQEVWEPEDHISQDCEAYFAKGRRVRTIGILQAAATCNTEDSLTLTADEIDTTQPKPGPTLANHLREKHRCDLN